MKRSFKSLISLILAVALSLSVWFFAFAEGEEQQEQNDITPADIYAEDTVAILYLCSNMSGFPSLGHIWIYIENVSDQTLTVGKYELPAGEGVSVGTFALTRSDGMGIYYNVEAYCGNLFSMKSPLYIKKEINQSQLNAVSRKILNGNFWEPMFMNCVFFAAGSWDAAGGSFVFPVTMFPIFARLQMKLKGAKTDLTMFNPGRDRVYKQKGSGSSATLKVVSDGTVDTVPG